MDIAEIARKKRKIRDTRGIRVGYEGIRVDRQHRSVRNLCQIKALMLTKKFKSLYRRPSVLIEPPKKRVYTMLGGIYKIENVTNGKIYIGQSKHVHARLKEHKSSLKRRYHTNKALQSDYNAGHTFTTEILKVVHYSRLIMYENLYIEKYATRALLYNHPIHLSSRVKQNQHDLEWDLRHSTYKQIVEKHQNSNEAPEATSYWNLPRNEVLKTMKYMLFIIVMIALGGLIINTIVYW